MSAPQPKQRTPGQQQQQQQPYGYNPYAPVQPNYVQNGNYAQQQSQPPPMNPVRPAASRPQPLQQQQQYNAPFKASAPNPTAAYNPNAYAPAPATTNYANPTNNTYSQSGYQQNYAPQQQNVYAPAPATTAPTSSDAPQWYAPAPTIAAMAAASTQPNYAPVSGTIGGSSNSYSSQQYAPVPVPLQNTNTTAASGVDILQFVGPTSALLGGAQSNPDTAQMAANIGLQFGERALNAGQEYVNQNLNRWFSFTYFKYYFSVSNSYVWRKVLLVLVPFRHKQWQRQVRHNQVDGQPTGYRAPRDDLNAPDLYIPVMAFVTYILLSGFILGLNETFHPETLGATGSKALMCTALELIYIKVGCYVLSITGDVPFLDLMSFTGYKFIGIIITSIVGLLVGGTFRLVSYVYFSLALGFFLLRSLRATILPESATTLPPQQRRRRVHFLLSIAVIQIALTWILMPAFTEKTRIFSQTITPELSSTASALAPGTAVAPVS